MRLQYGTLLADIGLLDIPKDSLVCLFIMENCTRDIIFTGMQTYIMLFISLVDWVITVTILYL